MNVSNPALRLNPTILVFLTPLIFFAGEGSALILGGGAEELRDRGWPVGVLNFVNHPDRKKWWEGPPFGGGEWTFHFESRDSAAVNERLQDFAAIQAPELRIVINDWNPPKDPPAAESTPFDRIEWSALIWVPGNWHFLNNNPVRNLHGRPGGGHPVPPPTVSIAVGSPTLSFEDLAIPHNVTLVDQRETSSSHDLSEGSIVEGVVYDMATGKTVDDATVTILQEYRAIAISHTDNEGKFRVEGLPGATVGVEVSSPGFSTRSIGAGDRDRKTYTNCVVELCQAVDQDGIVVDRAGKPIPGATVEARTVLGIDGEVYSHPSKAVTDVEGKFLLSGLPTGHSSFWVRAKGFHRWDPDLKKIPVKDHFRGGSGIYEQTTQLRFEMIRTGTIVGRLLDANGNPPSEKILVSAEATPQIVGSSNRSGEVNADGGFKIEEIPPGEYLLTVYDKGADSVGYQEINLDDNRIWTIEEGEEIDVGVIRWDP